MPLLLLTADEKIQELQQIVEAKNLELDEQRVQLEATGAEGAGSVQGQQLKELAWHAKSALNDLHSA